MYHVRTENVKRNPPNSKIPNQETGFSWRVCRAGFLSRAEAQRRGVWDLKANNPLSPAAKQGKILSGMEVGTPFPARVSGDEVEATHPHRADLDARH